MTTRDPSKPVKVTVSDPETGEIFEGKLLSNDYCIICAGNRYVKSVRAMGRRGRATHIIAVAVMDGENKRPEECRCTDDYQFDPRCDGKFCAGADEQNQTEG